MPHNIVFTPQALELQALAREIADKHVRPLAAKYDKAQEYNYDAARAVAEVSDTRTKAGGGNVKVKLHDKKGALDALARHLGLFVERHELTGKDGGELPPLKVVILGTLPSSETG